MSAPEEHPAGRGAAAFNADYTRNGGMSSEAEQFLKGWLLDQQRLAESERTGRGVLVLIDAEDGPSVVGPAVVERAERAMVALRSKDGTRVYRLGDVARVDWAPPVKPEVKP